MRAAAARTFARIGRERAIGSTALCPFSFGRGYLGRLAFAHAQLAFHLGLRARGDADVDALAQLAALAAEDLRLSAAAQRARHDAAILLQRAGVAMMARSAQLREVRRALRESSAVAVQANVRRLLAVAAARRARLEKAARRLQRALRRALRRRAWERRVAHRTKELQRAFSPWSGARRRGRCSSGPRAPPPFPPPLPSPCHRRSGTTSPRS